MIKEKDFFFQSHLLHCQICFLFSQFDLLCYRSCFFLFQFIQKLITNSILKTASLCSVLFFISLTFSETKFGNKECYNTFSKEIKQNKWMSYEEAKAFIHSKGIRSEEEFRNWRKSGKRPSNFPSAPERIYKEDWQGWKDFLGKNWMSYEEAKAFIHSKGIRSQEEFRNWRKSGKRPSNFPSAPERTYKEDWQGWKDFLGKNWMSYEEAKAFIHSKGIRSEEEFRNWRKSGKRPSNFPSAPERAYKEDWQGWKDFLGKNWMSYEEAKAFIHSKGIRSQEEFRNWRKSGKRPSNFPSAPERAYKEDWQGWKDFLGKNWMSYEEAKAFILHKKIGSEKKFRIWRKEGLRPSNLPSEPQRVYKRDWQGWTDFLGKNWMSYEEAKTLIRSAGIHSITEFHIWKEEGKRPANFPSAPDKVYKKDWQGWQFFLLKRERKTK